MKIALDINSQKYWVLIIILSATTIKIIPGVAGGFRVYEDPLIFQHIGWYITQGAIPYVDFYEIKPPAVHEANALISLLSGGDMYTQHILSISLMNGIVILSILLVGLIVFEITGDRDAGIIGSVSFLTLPVVSTLGWGGFFAKSFALFTGLLGLYLVLKQRWILAGISVAFSPAFWQFGLIFPILVLFIGYGRTSLINILYIILGSGLTSLIVLLPVLLWGGFSEMLASVILVPFYASGTPNPISMMVKAGFHLQFGSFVLLFSIFGIIYSFYVNKRYWWVLTGAGWFFAQLTFIDYDGARDLYLGMAFAAIGIGLLYSKSHKLPKIRRSHITTLVVMVIFANFFVGGQGLYSGMSVKDSIKSSTSNNDYKENLHDIYWNKQTPKSCYYTAPFSGDLDSWISQYNQPYQRSDCPSLTEAFRMSN